MTNLKEKMREEFETQFCHKMTANPKMFFMDSNAGVGSIEAFIEHYMDLAEKEMKKKCLNTVSGWCCACDYDIAVMEEKIKKAGAKKGEYGMYEMGYKEGKKSAIKKTTPTTGCSVTPIFR
jgi:hypothetical protein